MSILQTAGFVLLFFVLYGVLLVACERKIIFHPNKYPEGIWNPESFGVQVEDVFFETEDRVKLHGWFVPVDNPKGTLLWFHGNAGNLSHRLDNIRRLRPLDLNIFIFDYRGYGKSEGEPDEAGIYIDSQAAYDTLVKDKNIDPDSLILFGRSLGGICAVHTAASNKAAGLILESVFTNAEAMAKQMFPIPLGWAISSKLDAIGKVGGLTLPKLFLHGTKDEVVPYSMGRELFEAAGEPKTFYEIRGAGHNNTYFVGGPAYFDAWGRFVNETLARARPAGT